MDIHFSHPESQQCEPYNFMSVLHLGTDTIGTLHFFVISRDSHKNRHSFPVFSEDFHDHAMLRCDLQVIEDNI
jgi:hypothetical protein